MKSEVISFKITFQVIIHILKKEYQTITFQLAMYLDMSRETAHWGRRSRTTPSLPRHRDLRAFVSCMA